VNDLIDTTEMYLRTIFELEEEGIVPLRARIAERLHQSGPTVSQTVARMERDGLLTVEGDRHLQLSEAGRQLATAVMRKHRLAECLLVDVIGLEYADVHEEACRWEHVMSEAVERKLLTLLGNPTVSPFGNPIPGLDALGGDTSAVLDALTLLSTTATPEGREVVVRRISEQLQEDGELLRALADQGVRPGQRVTASVVNGAVLVDGTPLPPGVAQHVFVSPVDEDLTPAEAAEATASVG
jgi:DtxR family Mn-dependent transcriptional regulator